VSRPFASRASLVEFKQKSPGTIKIELEMTPLGAYRRFAKCVGPGEEGNLDQAGEEAVSLRPALTEPVFA
jgi:hypothetical protein